MSDEQNGSLPSEVSRNLTEFSPSGFILFILNEQGSPEVFTFYDSDMGALALQNFAAMWMNAVYKTQADSVLNMVNESSKEENSEPEEE
jgi:hypothetical protein